MQKPFTIGILREITDQYESGEISYAKMVEMLNDIAIKWHEQIPTVSKMETTQTAVEWFYQRILAKDIKEVYAQAKQMEKEQIMDSYSQGVFDGAINDEFYESIKASGEQYYNETYNK